MGACFDDSMSSISGAHENVMIGMRCKTSEQSRAQSATVLRVHFPSSALTDREVGITPSCLFCSLGSVHTESISLQIITSINP